jgi:hypothetical protein
MGSPRQRRISIWQTRALWFYGQSRTEVVAKLTATLRSQQQGLPAILEQYTVAQFLTRWLE